jgi:asparagine synthase (glutamine-hydrolysing)
MSGIVGIHRLDDRLADPLVLSVMLDAIAHRGPHGASQWMEGQVGFGHRMLCTMPGMTEERFPLLSRSGNLVLTADARIDNREELLAALDMHEPSEGKVGDGQLILGAYEKWQERCPEKLVGDFAFVIWDRPNRALFCARDHLGVRPFYYYHRPARAFMFASEIKALACSTEVPLRLNEMRVADYLLDLVEFPADTFYLDILRLPPGHVLVVQRGIVSVRRYWSPDPAREMRLASDQDYAEAFGHLFTLAVRSRLRSISPLGVCLSGGLDSSAVACVARENLARDGRTKLKAFSLLFEGAPGGDERTYIHAVTDQGGIEPHYIHADSIGPLADLDLLLHQYEAPLDNPHVPSGWALWREVHRQGVDVLLDGVDGDVTLSYSFHYLAELARQGRWPTLMREAVGLSRHFYSEQVSPFSIIWRLAITPLFPSLGRRLRPSSPPSGALPHDVGALINPDFARRLNVASRLRQLAQMQRRIKTSRQAHCSELANGVVAHGLESTNKLTSAFGIEPRHPFFDKRLVDFCLALPREQRTRDGWTRVIVRRALGERLPQAVRSRGSKWTPNQFFALRFLAQEKDRLEDLILNDSEVIEPYVNVTVARDVYRRHLVQPTVGDAYVLWTVANLALWLPALGTNAATRTAKSAPRSGI